MIIPFEKPKEPDPKCSFCGTPNSGSKKQFGNGQGKYICDKCVALATKRIKETA